MKVVIYTADLGRHDDVHGYVDQNLPPDWEVSWVRFADEFPPSAQDIFPTMVLRDPLGWEHRGTKGLPTAIWSSRLLGRWAKCHPHVLFPEADVTIWVDACLEITNPDFVWDVARQVTPGSPYAAFVHPDRHGILTEVEAADTLRKYDGNRHQEMADLYADTLGHRVTGLWAMTVLVRRNHHQCRKIDHLVWSETLRWSTREVTALDQIILPWVLDVLDDDLVPLEAPHPIDYHEPGTLWVNDWFVRHDHRRDT